MRRLIFLLPVAFIAASCWAPTPTVDVEQAANGAITISVRRGADSSVCVEAVGVSELDRPSGEVIWSIGQTSQYREICRSTFTYGETPVGFEVLADHGELVEGRSYRVGVGAPGFHSETTFVREPQ